MTNNRTRILNFLTEQGATFGSDCVKGFDIACALRIDSEEVDRLLKEMARDGKVALAHVSYSEACLAPA